MDHIIVEVEPELKPPLPPRRMSVPRRQPATTPAVLAILALGACSHSLETPVLDGGPPPDAPQAACRKSEGSGLGAQLIIRFDDGPCVFTLAQAQAGIRIPYTLYFENCCDFANMITAVPGNAGRCGNPDPSGFMPFERLAGGGQSYCRCDVGRCASPPMMPHRPMPGTYSREFAWDGRNWNGPSDTNDPEGAPFPPGAYTLTVTADGTWRTYGGDPGAPYHVESTLQITLTP